MGLGTGISGSVCHMLGCVGNTYVFIHLSLDPTEIDCHFKFNLACIWSLAGVTLPDRIHCSFWPREASGNCVQFTPEHTVLKKTGQYCMSAWSCTAICRLFGNCSHFLYWVHALGLNVNTMVIKPHTESMRTGSCLCVYCFTNFCGTAFFLHKIRHFLLCCNRPMTDRDDRAILEDHQMVNPG